MGNTSDTFEFTDTDTENSLNILADVASAVDIASAVASALDTDFADIDTTMIPRDIADNVVASTMTTSSSVENVTSTADSRNTTDVASTANNHPSDTNVVSTSEVTTAQGNHCSPFTRTGRLYNCALCLKSFKLYSSVYRHYRNTHVLDFDKYCKNNVKCEDCIRTFSMPTFLFKHIIIDHRKMPCHFCFKFIPKKYLSVHLKMHNKINTIVENQMLDQIAKQYADQYDDHYDLPVLTAEDVMSCANCWKCQQW